MKEVGKTYFDLVRRLPLVPITDDSHLERANDLLLQFALKANRGALTADEQAYRSVLSGLVSTYESDRFDFSPKMTPVELVRYLMEQNNLTQVDLAPLFGGQSCVSMFLSGKRALSKGQIEKLCGRFKLSATAFFAGEKRAAAARRSSTPRTRPAAVKPAAKKRR